MTGGTGLMGYQLAAALLGDGCRVAAIELMMNYY